MKGLPGRNKSCMLDRTDYLSLNYLKLNDLILNNLKNYILNELFAWTNPGETATLDFLPEVITYVIKTYARTFQQQMSLIPEAQKKLLIAIAKEGQARQITSMAFCKKHAMKSPSTVQSALRVLHEKGELKKDGDSYSVTNRFLGEWIRREY